MKEVHKAVTQHQIRMMSVENFWLPSGQSTGSHLVNQHLRSLHAHHQNRHQGMQTFFQASTPGQNNKDQASHPIWQGQCQDAVTCAQVLTWLIYSKIFCSNHAGQHSQMYISHFSQKLNASLPNQGLQFTQFRVTKQSNLRQRVLPLVAGSPAGLLNTSRTIYVEQTIHTKRFTFRSC